MIWTGWSRVVEQFPEQLDVAGDQVGALVAGEAAGPDDGQHVGVEELAGLVGDDAEQPLLEFALAVASSSTSPLARACSSPWSAQYFLFWALVTWVIAQMSG